MSPFFPPASGGIKGGQNAKLKMGTTRLPIAGQIADCRLPIIFNQQSAITLQQSEKAILAI